MFVTRIVFTGKYTLTGRGFHQLFFYNFEGERLWKRLVRLLSPLRDLISCKYAARGRVGVSGLLDSFVLVVKFATNVFCVCRSWAMYRNEALLAVVRLLPCVECGKVGHTQAAHSNQLRFGKGRGLKASDAAIMALCGPGFGMPGCHAELDQGSHMTKAERYAFEYEHIALTLIALLEAGFLVVNGGRTK